jgi:hypothetical protein
VQGMRTNPAARGLALVRDLMSSKPRSAPVDYRYYQDDDYDSHQAIQVMPALSQEHPRS